MKAKSSKPKIIEVGNEIYFGTDEQLIKKAYEQGKKDACKRIRHVLIDDDYLDQRISFFEWLADYEKGKELSK